MFSCANIIKYIIIRTTTELFLLQNIRDKTEFFKSSVRSSWRKSIWLQPIGLFNWLWHPTFWNETFRHWHFGMGTFRLRGHSGKQTFHNHGHFSMETFQHGDFSAQGHFGTNIFWLKDISAECFFSTVPVPKSLHVKMSTRMKCPFAGMSVEPKCTRAKMSTWWNVPAEMTVAETSGAKMCPILTSFLSGPLLICGQSWFISNAWLDIQI